jgi:excinuclease ABC subunit A
MKIVKIKDVDTKKINDYNSIFLVIDRIIVNGSKQFLDRVNDSISTAIFEGKGKCVVKNIDSNKYEYFNTNLELDGIKFTQPSVNFFSFNNPSGACKKM